MKTGTMVSPLPGGKAPAWLFKRMQALARGILSAIVLDFGTEEFLKRLSEPAWFQTLGCVLGFDWHSSGVTTTVCGALKEGINGMEAELGLYICGGKGGRSRRTPQEIEAYCEGLGPEPQGLMRSSKLSAKVDNNALQDGYQLYHHNPVDRKLYDRSIAMLASAVDKARVGDREKLDAMRKLSRFGLAG